MYHRLNTITHRSKLWTDYSINSMSIYFFPPSEWKQGPSGPSTGRNMKKPLTEPNSWPKFAKAPEIQVAGSSGAPHHERSWCHDASLAQSNHLLSDRGKPHRPQRSSSWIFYAGWEAIWVENSSCQNGMLRKESQHVTTLNQQQIATHLSVRQGCNSARETTSHGAIMWMCISIPWDSYCTQIPSNPSALSCCLRKLRPFWIAAQLFSSD